MTKLHSRLLHLSTFNFQGARLASVIIPGASTPSASAEASRWSLTDEPPLLTMWLKRVQYCGGSPGLLLAYTCQTLNSKFSMERACVSVCPTFRVKRSRQQRELQTRKHMPKWMLGSRDEQRAGGPPTVIRWTLLHPSVHRYAHARHSDERHGSKKKSNNNNNNNDNKEWPNRPYSALDGATTWTTDAPIHALLRLAL